MFILDILLCIIITIVGLIVSPIILIGGYIGIIIIFIIRGIFERIRDGVDDAKEARRWKRAGYKTISYHAYKKQKKERKKEIARMEKELIEENKRKAKEAKRAAKAKD